MSNDKLRRGAAILALVLGVGAALYTARDDSVDAEAVLLLGHVRFALPGEPPLSLGRDRLVGLRVQPSHTSASWVVSVDYARGQAPAATHALKLRLPSGVESLEVRCFYDGGGTTPLQGRSIVHIARQTALQTVDVEPCGVDEALGADQRAGQPNEPGDH